MIKFMDELRPQPSAAEFKSITAENSNTFHHNNGVGKALTSTKIRAFCKVACMRIEQPGVLGLALQWEPQADLLWRVLVKFANPSVDELLRGIRKLGQAVQGAIERSSDVPKTLAKSMRPSNRWDGKTSGWHISGSWDALVPSTHDQKFW
ncbi:hypothetical protein PGTUg99_015580 [Puccinia graminis f. sp. tritici]|uniref:Uncharacterized protein n=1 Tax=Puccinia graminis f. sp. tritici TaxID=56615 RepID=A0A5B0S6N1_PUCGR|nr:hypothetical protein PGTUg99_015580 [Puccinia graminis f. sp. tritici]